MSAQAPGAGAAVTLAELGEFALIREIVANLPPRPDVLLGPGDDAALLRLDGPAVLSMDVSVEGVHFRREWSSAADVGRKQVAINVADLEAMGARATGIVVGFSAPPDLPAAWALEFAAGLRAEAGTAGVALLGGDVTRSRDVTVAVTAVGQLTDGRAVLRDGARAGDEVAVIGRLGWAAAGLAVLSRGFRSPRAVVQAQQVPAVPYGAGATAARAGATSMIDVSDGLLADLGHVAEASGVRIDVQRRRLDVAEPLLAVGAAIGADPLTFVLTGGEDHALAATYPPGTVPTGWTVIGRVLETGQPAVLVDGRPWPGEPGWDHFASRPRRYPGP